MFCVLWHSLKSSFFASFYECFFAGFRADCFSVDRIASWKFDTRFHFRLCLLTIPHFGEISCCVLSLNLRRWSSGIVGTIPFELEHELHIYQYMVAFSSVCLDWQTPFYSIWFYWISLSPANEYMVNLARWFIWQYIHEGWIRMSAFWLEVVDITRRYKLAHNL